MGACCTDFDPPEFFSETWRKARKEHKCCECRQSIHIGQQYEYISGMWDGTIETFKTCEKCADLRASLLDVSCPELGNLKEHYFEHLHQTGAIRFNDDDEIIYPLNHLTISSG